MRALYLLPTINITDDCYSYRPERGGYVRSTVSVGFKWLVFYVGIQYWRG